MDNTEAKDKYVRVKTTLLYKEYYSLEATVPDHWDYEMIKSRFIDMFADGGMSPVDREVEVFDFDEEPVDE